MTRHFLLFDSEIGPMGLVWTPRGIAGVQIPDQDELRTRAALCRRFPDAEESRAAPPSLRDASIRIRALLAGEQTDLTGLALDLEGVPAFERRVYAATLAIPPGRTLTYGDVAREIGDGPGASRAVGRALGRNPIPIIVPCHRVVGAAGRMVGFSAPGGVSTKLRLLAIEGGWPNGQPDLFAGVISPRTSP
jgi:methylated-DNA-[protein]-cysteine S-methyltransferase